MDFKKFFGSIGGIAIIHFLLMCLGRCHNGLIILNYDLGEHIYMILGQPARVLWKNLLNISDGSPGFWIISIICSVIWGAVISTCLVKFFQKKS